MAEGSELVSLQAHFTFSGSAEGTPGKSTERHYHIPSLDVSFREDERRMRRGHSAGNFSRLCRTALNLIKNEKTTKGGVASRRKKCEWDNEYLVRNGPEITSQLTK